MSRGLNEKVSFRVRKGQYEEADRLKAAAYLEVIKKSKENKGINVFTRESEYDQYFDLETVLITPAEKVEAEGKKFKESLI
mgnify:CR=1 FL=1